MSCSNFPVLWNLFRVNKIHKKNAPLNDAQEIKESKNLTEAIFDILTTDKFCPVSEIAAKLQTSESNDTEISIRTINAHLIKLLKDGRVKRQPIIVTDNNGNSVKATGYKAMY